MPVFAITVTSVPNKSFKISASHLSALAWTVHAHFAHMLVISANGSQTIVKCRLIIVKAVLIDILSKKCPENCAVVTQNRQYCVR